MLRWVLQWSILYYLAMQPNVFNCLVLSLCMANISLLQYLVIWIKPGWFVGIRRSLARFRDEQSSKNWVSWVLVGLDNTRLFGRKSATQLRRLGKYLSLVSLVALHWVKMCTMSSIGVCNGWLWSLEAAAWQRRQEGSVPLSCARFE